MTAPPAIAGVYADLRQVKSRGVWQLVIDVPAEKVEGMVELFGMPRQDEPTWLGIARLKVSPEALDQAAPDHAATGSTPAEPKQPVASGETKERRPFHTLPLPQQVALRCADRAFQAWVAMQEGASADVSGEDLAARYVRYACGVDSRALILPGSVAADKWARVLNSFEGQTGRVTEQRG